MSENKLPIQQIDISDFNYDLPDELIARHPVARRDECRLLVAMPPKADAETNALERVLPEEGSVSHCRFDEILSLLPDDTLLVRNNTKVINARLHFFKETGAQIEIFLLDPLTPADYALNFQQTEMCEWKCLVGNLKKWKEGTLTSVAKLPDGRDVSITAERGVPLAGNAHSIRFFWTPAIPFGEIVSLFGNIPIPPYLSRDSEESDLTNYQTVYAKAQGSVAAPTAGLHFTDELFDRIRDSKRGIDVADVTLHVGAGTFRPVKSETLEGHDMHSETFTVSRRLVEQLLAAVSSDRLVAAVGTTTVRTLESLPYLGRILKENHYGANPRKPLHVSQWDPYLDDAARIDTEEALREILTEMNLQNVDSLTASTSILIGPSFNWRIVEAMITNFHQPESTLLLLISSFLGMVPETVSDPDSVWRCLYREAVAEGYRFLSYGDACLFFRFPRVSGIPLNIPGSKSITNRAVILNALSAEKAELRNASDSSDTASLLRFVEALKEGVANGKPVDFYMGDGAAPFRFAAALAAVTPGADVYLYPSSRLAVRFLDTESILFNETPLELNYSFISSRYSGLSRETLKSADLYRDGKKIFCYHILGHDMLAEGALAGWLEDQSVFGDENPEKRESEIVISASDFMHTSQEVSALLLVSSLLPPMTITDLHTLPSLPYAMMTAMLLHSFGARIATDWTEDDMPGAFHTSPVPPRAPEIYLVESDWSALLNFHAFAVAARFAEPPLDIALSAPWCPPPLKSLQPDSRQSVYFETILSLADLSPEERLDNTLDMNFIYTPDALPPIVAACVVAGVPFLAKGLVNLVWKESNRLAALKKEFGKLGWKLSCRKKGEYDHVFSYNGAPRGPFKENPLLDSHGDHRIAMALAATLPVTCRFRLRAPQCVAKSMPNFWDELATLGVTYAYDPATDIAQLDFRPA